MANQSQGASTRSQEVSRRQERAHRILDAAAALILRWGYDKTTIDDIARQAGVAKGTIYLHWKTREELFTALVKREGVEMAEDFTKRIIEDPAGSTLRGVYRHTALALMKRPLLKAFLLRDIEVIGKLAHSEHSSAAYVEKLAGFETYLEFLRERGLVRTDLGLRAEVYTVTAIFMGFFLMAPLVPDELKLADEEMADLIGEAVHCTLEVGRSVSPDELQTVSNTFMAYLNRTVANSEEQFRQGLGS